MVPDEAPKTGPEQAASPTQRAPRRSRHPGRGRRGRGAGRGRRPERAPFSKTDQAPPPAGEAPEQELPVAEPADVETRPETAPQYAPETEPVQPRPLPIPKQPASPATIQGAIDHVNEIIESLRESLDDMEEVLETLELAERQKNADEQEIEQLRRSLRHLQTPRDRDRGHSR